MEVVESLIDRNATFSAEDFSAALKIMPSKRTMIIGCVDPRVDPADIFDLAAGEAVVIRNVGGRVDPAVLLTMSLLRSVVKGRGGDIGRGWHLVVLHHTDCGIIDCARHAPVMLAKQFGVETDKLAGLAIDDPYAAVALDVAALKGNPNLPGGIAVTGLVYDVQTGKVEIVVPEALLRPDDAD